MGNETLKFKSDRFRKSRGGHSRWLLILCEKCKEKLFFYQKDGPGILKRLYLDRIFGRIKIDKNLICQECKTVLGIPIMYKKENRKTLRLFAGAVAKQVISADKVKKFLHPHG